MVKGLDTIHLTTNSFLNVCKHFVNLTDGIGIFDHHGNLMIRQGFPMGGFFLYIHYTRCRIHLSTRCFFHSTNSVIIKDESERSLHRKTVVLLYG